MLARGHLSTVCHSRTWSSEGCARTAWVRPRDQRAGCPPGPRLLSSLLGSWQESHGTGWRPQCQFSRTFAVLLEEAPSPSPGHQDPHPSEPRDA